MGFLDLFSHPSSPLAILAAAKQAPPAFMQAGNTAPQILADPSADGNYGLSTLDLSGAAAPQVGVNAAPWDTAPPSIDLGANAGAKIPAGPLLPGEGGYTGTYDPVNAFGGSGPSTSSISDLINGLLGPQPSLDQLFSSAPYEQAIAQLGAGKDSATKSISDNYAKALQSLAATRAAAQQDQAQFAANTQASSAQATAAQQAFLRSLGITAADNSALGANLSGQAARMAQDQSNQAQTNARLASIQNNDLSQAQQEAQLGQMGSLNQLAAQVAGAQSKVTQQESTDRGNALKELAGLMSARQSQAGSLMNNAQSFIDKSTTSVNSRNRVEDELNQMAQTGDPTARVVGTIIHGIPQGSMDAQGNPLIAQPAAPDMATALTILANPANKLPPGVDQQKIMQLLNGYYSNATTKQQPPNMMDSLKQYLSALTGQG